jgi:hypothetical protein
MGNRRPLSERQCAREAQDRRSRRRARSRLPRNIEALKAVQPADLEPGDISARSAPPGFRRATSGIHRELLDTFPEPSRRPFAAPSPPGRSTSTARRKSNVSNTTTTARRAPRLRPDRAGALNGRTPTALRRDRQGHPRHQPAGNHRRARGAAAAQGPLQRMDLAGRGTRASGWPATITTRSTICACAPSTART